MAIQSAGILVYRKAGTSLEVLLVHPGGPFWARKDTWSIPKGEADTDEDLLHAAQREFQEEVGMPAPTNALLELGAVRQDSRKTNHIWAVEGNLDIAGFKSNVFTMEWPPKSGQQQEFPENDRAKWFPIEVAKTKVFKAQQIFFDTLAEKVGVDLAEPPEQQSLL